MIKKNASELTEEKIFEFLNQEFDEEEWSPRTYNNHLRFFSTLFSRTERLERKQNKGIKYQIDLDHIENPVDLYFSCINFSYPEEKIFNVAHTS